MQPPMPGKRCSKNAVDLLFSQMESLVLRMDTLGIMSATILGHCAQSQGIGDTAHSEEFRRWHSAHRHLGHWAQSQGGFNADFDTPPFDVDFSAPGGTSDKPAFDADFGGPRDTFDKPARDADFGLPGGTSDKPAFDADLGAPRDTLDKPAYDADSGVLGGTSDKPEFEADFGAPGGTSDKPTFDADFSVPGGTSDTPAFDADFGARGNTLDHADGNQGDLADFQDCEEEGEDEEGSWMSHSRLQDYATHIANITADITAKSCKAGMRKEFDDLYEVIENYKQTVEEYKYQEKNWEAIMAEREKMLREDDIQIEKLQQEIETLRKIKKASLNKKKS